MISHRNQLRRWAVRTLLVWLFGLVSGIVNACVLDSPADHIVGKASVEHALSYAQQGDWHKTDEANCQDFCELSSVAVPSQTTALDKVGLSAIPIGFASAALPLAPSLRLQPVRPLRRNSAPPIPIEFLRLTL